MDNNTAFLATIGDIKEIPGADKIVSATVFLKGVPQTTVVVGKDMVEGTLVVYFDTNLCLTEEFINRIDNEDPEKSSTDFRGIGTYLGKNGRVKAIKLRGCVSNGLVISASRLHTFITPQEEELFVDGYSFTEIGGMKVCHKYVSPEQTVREKAPKEKKKNKVLRGHFEEHLETVQLTRNIDKISPDDIIHISEKWHGTSARTGNVLVKRIPKWYEKVLIKLGVQIPTTRYAYVHGSRRVVKYITGDIIAEQRHYYETDLWKQAGEKYFGGKLHEGEVVYYEIVGWAPNGNPIQKLGKAVYNYGANPGQYKIVVYRITLTNSQGFTIDYSPQQLKYRCGELGVDTVVEIYHGKAKDLFPEIPTDSWWRNNFLDALRAKFLEKIRTDCIYPTTYDEGIVVRVEGFTPEFYKFKSDSFYTCETKALEGESVTDMEEGNV